MSKPDEQVADRIIDQLRKLNLLSETALGKLKPQIATGKLSAEDWKLMVELDREDKAKGADENH
jgi:hypothetical protein